MNQDILNFQKAMNFLYTGSAWIPGYVPLVEDGIYGPKTREALIAFQRLHELPLTGQYDPDTHNRLHYVLSMTTMSVNRQNKIDAGTFVKPRAGVPSQAQPTTGNFLLPNVEIKGAFARALPWVLLAGAGYYIYNQTRKSPRKV